MSVQFKFKVSVGAGRQREVLRALTKAGFAPESLFPGQTRPSLASIYTVPNAEAKDLKSVNAILSKYKSEIDYVEPAPERRPKF